MLDEKVLGEVKSLLPEYLHGFAYIAGGYAHNQEKAQDIDVWVLSRDNFDIDVVVKAIEAHLGSLGKLSYVTVAEPYDGVRIPTTNIREYRLVHTEMKFDIPDIQLLATNAKTVKELLAQFDITTHRIARPLTAPTVFYVGDGYFPLGLEPRVTRWDTPLATRRRLERIALRYGFQPNTDDINKLVDLELGLPIAA